MQLTPPACRSILRLFFGYFTPPALLILTLAGLFLVYGWEQQLHELRREEQITLAPGAKEIERIITRRTAEVQTLAGLTSLTDFIEHPTVPNRKRATADLITFARNSRIYSQIAYLDRAGMERIRVNLTPQSAVAVPDKDLQSRADRYYFKEAARLENNQIYLSNFDLKKSRGVVEIPHTPVLRLLSPLGDSSGSPRGMLLFYYLGEDLLQRIGTSSVHTNSLHYLVNSEGYWLHAPDQTLTWGFMRNRPELSMAHRYPTAWHRISAGENGQFRDKDGLWTYSTATPLHIAISNPSLAQRTWKLVSHIPTATLDAAWWRLAQPVFLTVILALLLAGGASWQLARVRHWRQLREYERWIDSKRMHAVEQLYNDSRLTEQELFDQALNIVVELTSSSIGYIYYYDEETRLFTLHAWSHQVMQGCSIMQPQTIYELEKTGLWGEAVRQRSPQLVNNYLADNPYKKGYPEGHVQLTRFLTIPVFDQDRIVAVVGVANKKDPYSESDRNQLELFMQGVWQMTLRRRMERESAEQLHRIDLLLNSTAEGIYAVDLQGCCVMANRACACLLGYEEPAMLLHRQMHELMHHSHADGSHYPAADCKAHRAIEIGTPTVVEDELFWRKDGSSLPVSYTALPIRDGEKITGMVCVFRDITERLKVEQEQSRLLTVLEESLNEIYIFNTDSLRFTYANRSALQNLGYSMEELSHLTAFSIKPLISEVAFRLKLEALTNGKSRKLEFQTIHQRKDGSSYPVEVHLQLIQAGTQASYLAIIFDITERTALEEQLRHAQKLESIGQLSSGIAHDFNNILQIISGNAQMLQLHNSSAGKTQPEQLNDIMKAVERGTRLTSSMLAFSRRQNMSLRQTELNNLLQETEQLAARLLPQQHRLVVSLHENPLPVSADPTLLQQVLFNLVTNARDAMPDGGTITVSTGICNYKQNDLLQNGLGEPGLYAQLKVSDTGQGISDEIRHRIFEPFFTTKAVGRGTGLGLSMIYGTIQQHNGFILLDTQPGAGSCFTVFLPLDTTA